MRCILFRETWLFIRIPANNTKNTTDYWWYKSMYTPLSIYVCARKGWLKTENIWNNSRTEPEIYFNVIRCNLKATNLYRHTQKNHNQLRKVFVAIQHLRSKTYAARIDSNGPPQNLLINYLTWQWGSLVRHPSKYICQSKIQNIISPPWDENVLTL